MTYYHGKGSRKERGKVSDQTRGGSMLDPKNYKGDVLVQVWVDSRVLATLSNWLDHEGRPTRFMSEVVKDCLKVLCDHVVNEGAVEMVDHTADARDWLQRKYRVNLNPHDRGWKNVQHNIMLSERREKLGAETLRVEDVSRPGSGRRRVDEDILKRGEEIYKQKEEEDRKAAEEEEKKRQEQTQKDIEKYSEKKAAEASASGENEEDETDEDSETNDESVMKEGELSDEAFAKREKEKKEAEDKAHQEFLNSVGKK